MEYIPKEIQEEVNVTPIHPLGYFLKVALSLALWGIVLYLITGAIADQLTRVLPPKTEASIGQTLVSPLAAVDIRPDTERQLQRLLNELQTQAGSRLPKAQLHLIESEEINAAALPGGQIILTTGLLDQAQSENELAFVLAHELGHHQLRHPLKGLGRSLLWIIVLSVLGLGQEGSSILNQPLTFTDLQFSRVQEQDSDRYALAVINARYGHVNHSLDFFIRLNAKKLDPISQKLQIEFLSTHPFPKTRIKDLERFAEKQNWSLTGSPTDLTLP
jgi:beta-barrel assembly-enhancing protease